MTDDANTPLVDVDVLMEALMTKNLLAATLFTLGLVVPIQVGAAVGNCSIGDAPDAYDNETCQGVCVEAGNEVTCSLEPLCPSATNFGSEATAVTNFSGHDVSIFGSCLSGGPKFCCVFDEGANNVDIIEILGTDDSDEVLKFTHIEPLVGEFNLQPWDADPIDGFIRGLIGADRIEGSNYAGLDYDDNLFGNRGADTIVGNDGRDFISGGDQDDTLIGGDHNDTIWGGDGDDTLTGNDGHDKLCDASGYNACATDGGNVFNGGNGNDKLWYNESENPNVPCPNILMSLASDPGAGDDECGDHNDFGTSEFPTSCEFLITVEPNTCDGAN